MNPRLRYTELEMRRANAGLSASEELKLARYKKLVSKPDQNLSAEAWRFWKNVGRDIGLERYHLKQQAKQTQEAENWP